MAEKLGTFDAQAFYEALDATRQAKELNWKDIASESGVSASTLTRMAQGKRPDVDSLAALVVWSGLKSEEYLVSTTKRRSSAEPLAAISTYLRADKNLSPASVDALTQIINAAYKQMKKRG